MKESKRYKSVSSITFVLFLLLCAIALFGCDSGVTPDEDSDYLDGANSALQTTDPHNNEDPNDFDNTQQTNTQQDVIATKVGESQVFSDTEMYYKSLLSTEGMQIVSLNIYDRKTDSSNRTDKVFVELVSKNNVCTVTKRLSLEYYRYDDGWDLEETNPIHNNVVINNTASTLSAAQKELMQSSQFIRLGQATVEYSHNNSDLSIGTDSYYFDISVEKAYCTEHYFASVTYEFSGISWYFDSVEITQQTSTWKVLGEWHYNSLNTTIWINILSIDGNDFEMEYEIKYKYSTLLSNGIRIVSSNGIRYVYGDESRDTDFKDYLEISLRDGVDPDGNYVDAGWLKLYPETGLNWNAVFADEGPCYLYQDSRREYKVYVMDSNGTPVSGLFVQLFKIDSVAYTPQKTDENGCAVWLLDVADDYCGSIISSDWIIGEKIEANFGNGFEVALIWDVEIS